MAANVQLSTTSDVPIGTATNPLNVTGGAAATTDSTGLALPANFNSLPQTLGYDGSNNLTSIAKTNGVNTWTQTLTYTSSNLTAVSAWVKS